MIFVAAVMMMWQVAVAGNGTVSSSSTFHFDSSRRLNSF
jgi:hypothetical protein